MATMMKQYFFPVDSFNSKQTTMTCSNCLFGDGCAAVAAILIDRFVFCDIQVKHVVKVKSEVKTLFKQNLTQLQIQHPPLLTHVFTS